METALPVPRRHHRANPAALGLLLCGGVWRERVEQMARGTIHPKKSDHNRAKTIPWIACDLHGAQGSSENERKDPKFMC